MPTHELQHWPVDRLIPYARNPRKNDDAVQKIADAIQVFGFRVPIIARSDGLVVDGHLRLKAAQALRLATVPVLLADDLSENQIKAFRISVNRMAELAEWDMELLSHELANLKREDFDLALTGFDEYEIHRLIDGKPNPSTTQDPPASTDPGKPLICPRCGAPVNQDSSDE